MLSFRVDDEDADTIQRWADTLGVVLRCCVTRCGFT